MNEITQFLELRHKHWYQNGAKKKEHNYVLFIMIDWYRESILTDVY